MAAISLCNIDGCDKPVLVKRRGLCRAHYLRWKRNGDPTSGGKMQADAGEALRYLNDVVMSYEAEGCLIWPFSRSKGSAMIYIDGRNARVARIVCERESGPAPTPDHEAAHSCGKGHEGCVNRHHLRWATPSENNRDKLAHGTHNRGERHSLARLTASDVREIRRLRGIEAQSAVARKFDVSVSTVKDIHAGRTWGWLQ